MRRRLTLCRTKPDARRRIVRPRPIQPTRTPEEWEPANRHDYNAALIEQRRAEAAAGRFVLAVAVRRNVPFLSTEVAHALKITPAEAEAALRTQGARPRPKFEYVTGDGGGGPDVLVWETDDVVALLSARGVRYVVIDREGFIHNGT